MFSIFPAHAPADAACASELSAFLESGCDALCSTEDAAIRPGEDLLSSAETGLSADILLLLLSAASNPAHWARDIWEPLLFRQASETGTRVAIFLLEDCRFPELLRRKVRCFDGTASRLNAMRQVKRWLAGMERGTEPAMHFSPELEMLYRALADQPGTVMTSGSEAERFAQEATHDFEAIFRISARGGALSRIAGELGSQMGMRLDGTVEENCLRIGQALLSRRCLVVTDAPPEAIASIIPSGRTSVLFVCEPLQSVETPKDIAAARCLVSAGRLGEAYEALYELLDRGVETENCARELVWICEYWDRFDEAAALRSHIRPTLGEQLRLF